MAGPLDSCPDRGLDSAGAGPGQQFNVTADANGDVSIAIATAGAADADAMNGAFYSSSLTIAFHPDTSGGGTTCTFTNFGTACKRERSRTRS